MRVIDLSHLQTFTAVNFSSDPGEAGGPVIVPQCAQIVLIWGQEDAKFAHNVLYGRYSGTYAGNITQANSILTALTTGAAWTALAGFLHTSSTLAGVSLRDVNTRDQALVQSGVAGAPGTGTGSALPNETAAVVTLRTALAGRGNRGRFYMPGFSTNALGAGNVINAATVTAINNWAATINSAFSAQGYTFVLGQKHRIAYISPTTGVSHPDRPANSQPIVAATCKDNHWDTQRRRGLK